MTSIQYPEREREREREERERELITHLQIVVVHDADERVAQSRYLHAVADLTYEDDGVDVRADVVQQAGDEGGLVDGEADQILPQLLVAVLLAELDRLADVTELCHDQLQCLLRVSHAPCNKTTL